MSKRGPITLPEPLTKHCAVLIKNKVYMFGGNSNSKKVLSFQIHNGAMNYLSNMNIGRSYHGCASFENDEKMFIIVAGGHTTKATDRQKTELFNVEDNSWTPGKFPMNSSW